MREIKDTCYKGVRILLGDDKRNAITQMIYILQREGFEEISIPIIQYQSVFEDKVGDNKNLMFNFSDRADRDVCLAPEYTSVIQELSKSTFKNQKNVKLFYIQECFRGEKPQAGRYRQFTQLGVEILNPTVDYLQEGYNLQSLAMTLLNCFDNDSAFLLKNNVTRGLDYYKQGKGFEITCVKLGAQKQICGGGEYEGGVGFAIGIDRLLLTKELSCIFVK